MQGIEKEPIQPIDRPIFILGVGRSGTTHLGRLLSAHPDVGWLNEPKLMWNLIVPGEDVSGFYSKHGKFLLSASDVTPKVRERAARAFSRYQRISRSRRVMDKYPEMTYRAEFIRELFPDAILVAIIRRPEDFVNSVVEWNTVHGFADEDWWGVGRRKWTHIRQELAPMHESVSQIIGSSSLSVAEMAASEWVLGMHHIYANRTKLDIIVNYEELATNPVSEIMRIESTCQLSPSRAVHELARATTSGRLRTDPADFGRLADAVAEVRHQLDV
ncbi:sulfotransferase [Nocardioides sp.]|uniref:sulfotransferase family protein n=1 Tax=Nocardioides sp. TaxID=35761 RepID=UPI00356B3492